METIGLASSTPDIKDLGPDSLESWLLARDHKKYNAIQLMKWLYQKRENSFDKMSDLSNSLRSNLKESFIHKIPELRDVHHSQDGSKKFLLTLADGAQIETVCIAHPKRRTLCLSTQVGCAMGCNFCRTAAMKLVRHLRPSEILGQVLAVQAQLSEAEPITNIVFMGMGEPLHNFSSLMEAVDILICHNAFRIGRRRITISTSGLVPEIKLLAERTSVKLAVSLNATTNGLRDKIMPINKKYPIEVLLEACREYSFKSGSPVTIEYVLLGGLNDTLEDARRLVKLLSHLPCKVNLIPYNEFSGSPYRMPQQTDLEAFFRYLCQKHFQVNIRWSKGRDIHGACGQLATESGRRVA